MSERDKNKIEIVVTAREVFEEAINHDDGHWSHCDCDYNVTYDSLLTQSQLASRYECYELVDNCIKLEMENRKSYSLLRRQLRFYKDQEDQEDEFQSIASRRQRRGMSQDGRRRQAVVLVLLSHLTLKLLDIQKYFCRIRRPSNC